MRLRGIGVHPVKSTAIRPLSSALVTPSGLAGDRRWMVVDADGVLVSARELHGLFRIVADTAETDEAVDVALRLSAPGMPALEVAAPDSDLIEVTLHGNVLLGRPANEETGRWIGKVTGRDDLRLVWCDDPTRRTFDRPWARPGDSAPYTDSAPISLASLDSLRRLNDWIAEGALARGEEPPAPLPVERFRPNLVVEGAEAFAEDGWTRVRVGEVWFRKVKDIDRCVMTTIAPEDLSTGKEPIRTLARYRQWDHKTWFAIHLVPEGSGAIAVGDAVDVL